MAKTSALDRAIIELDREIALRQLARDRLVALRPPLIIRKAKRGPRAVPGTDAKASV